MPVHSLATFFGDVSASQLVVGAFAFALIIAVKTLVGGRKCTWERDWAGKMVLVVGPPTPTLMTLIDQLLHLPSPPQVLFLPPLPSPLPEALLTVLHTIRLSATTKNPAAQLHCEPLPRTPAAVREFTAKWSSAPAQMVGEAGRRIDAIVLGQGWEVTQEYGSTVEGDWNTHQFHFHLLTSLLPSLLRAPAERNIRIVNLVSPTWSAALPSLTGVKARDDLVHATGRKSINTILLMRQFQLVLDTLEAATRGKVTPVPVPGADAQAEKATVKKRDKDVKSNVMAVSVVMGWARQEVVRGSLVSSFLSRIAWVLFYPLIILFTPSSKSVIQSILFALSAPVREGQIDETRKVADQGKEAVDVRREGVAGGDVVRDCAVVDLPPVLSDPALAKAVYDQLEKEVEQGVKAAQDQKKERQGKTQ
ncbi:hypothetical protein IAU60_000111 [Kwoniella sp. DSM 27419]